MTVCYVSRHEQFFLTSQPSSSSSAHPAAQLPSDHSQTSPANSTVPTQSVIVIDAVVDSESKVEIAPPPQNTTTTEAKRTVISAAPVSVLVRVPPHIPPAIPASIAAPNAQVPSALPVPSHIHGRLNSSSSSMPIPSIPTPAIVSSPSASSPPSFMGSAKQVCFLNKFSVIYLWKKNCITQLWNLLYNNNFLRPPLQYMYI